MAEIQVRKDDLRQTRAVDGEARRDAVEAGEVQLELERFSLTANNVTYGVFGDALGYWRFFPPAEDGWGCVPAWGFGEVVASGVPGVEPGERFYGFFPMAARRTLRAEPGGGGFTAADEHRRELPAVYNQYLRTPAEAPHPDITVLVRPLFATAFLLDEMLRREGSFGAQTVLLSSASSKTALATAFQLARRADGPPAVGLTSPANAAWTQSLGLYDRVATYEEVEAVVAGDEPLAYLDFSGDAALRRRIHEGAGERLEHSAVIGATHWEDTAAAGDEPLPGPEPALFFAPTHAAALTEELGRDELLRRMDHAWSAFADRADGWLDVEHGHGADAVQQVWRGLVDGTADPRTGHVLHLRG
ncbi:MAG: hypothetical protein AVDCRST_MAG30-4667 [uncultured Solirubrobacteraceae bacterium]|uniref:Bll1370 protein n=1 Tax=uncultured Solirubrobacteraceae bacterium TaxID=1162706 RepID=A0A6J4U4F3_9ACTN|nr:MAG: hypothetical protein AVDCRST_MAG30-4667 [uncultured Solirubrobacteraceae bacterium]